MTNASWYLGRGTGVSALVMFTIVMVLGIVVRSGRPLPGLPRFAVSAVHRTASLTALGLLAVHITTLYLDPFAQLRLVDLVMPFRGAYRPLWLGLGTLAADLIVVLIGTSLLRQHIGRRTWRVLHWAAYACWPFAMAHAIGNGTDGTTSWLLAIAAGCAVTVVGALAWRLAVVAAEPRPSAEAAASVPSPPNLTGVRG
jgi:predicted ferric reductase